MRLKVAVNRRHTGSNAHNQLLPSVGSNWLGVRTHFGIGVVFLRQCENGHQQTTMLFVIEEFEPLLVA